MHSHTKNHIQKCLMHFGVHVFYLRWIILFHPGSRFRSDTLTTGMGHVSVLSPTVFSLQLYFESRRAKATCIERERERESVCFCFVYPLHRSLHGLLRPFCGASRNTRHGLSLLCVDPIDFNLEEELATRQETFGLPGLRVFHSANYTWYADKGVVRTKDDLRNACFDSNEMFRDFLLYTTFL